MTWAMQALPGCETARTQNSPRLQDLCRSLPQTHVIHEQSAVERSGSRVASIAEECRSRPENNENSCLQGEGAAVVVVRSVDQQQRLFDLVRILERAHQRVGLRRLPQRALLRLEAEWRERTAGA